MNEPIECTEKSPLMVVGKEIEIDVEDDFLYTGIFSVQGMIEKIEIYSDHTWTYENNLPFVEAITENSNGILSKEDYDTFVQTIRESDVMKKSINQKNDNSLVCDGNIRWDIQLNGKHATFSTPCVEEYSAQTHSILDTLNDIQDKAKELVFSKKNEEGSCEPVYTISVGPELTASQNYGEDCLSADTEKIVWLLMYTMKYLILLLTVMVFQTVSGLQLNNKHLWYV